jgi:hypothetical protein
LLRLSVAQPDKEMGVSQQAAKQLDPLALIREGSGSKMRQVLIQRLLDVRIVAAEDVLAWRRANLAPKS